MKCLYQYIVEKYEIFMKMIVRKEQIKCIITQTDEPKLMLALGLHCPAMSTVCLARSSPSVRLPGVCQA